MSELTDLSYVEEQGPGIAELDDGDDQELEALPVPPGGEQEVLPGWDEKTIRQFLTGAGAGLHLMLGAGEADWLMTQEDLERIAPPLTRMSNRYQPMLALSPYGDPLLVAAGLGLYGWRSTLQTVRAKRDQAAHRQASKGASYTRVEDGAVDVDHESDAEDIPRDGLYFARGGAEPDES